MPWVGASASVLVEGVGREVRHGVVGREEQERLETTHLAEDIVKLIIVARRQRIPRCDKALREDQIAPTAEAAHQCETVGIERCLHLLHQRRWQLARIEAPLAMMIHAHLQVAHVCLGCWRLSPGRASPVAGTCKVVVDVDG